MTDPAAPAPLRCSVAATARGDTLAGTAPLALGWLLLEHGSGWLPTTAATIEAAWGAGGGPIVRRCATLGVRAALIRRPGRRVRTEPARWGLADCSAYAPGNVDRAASITWGDLDGPDVVLAALDAFESGSLPGGGEPAYLVCTHGKKDVCCAIWGRPTAARLAQSYPEHTWETSHTGGDRFAPNLVLLPEGLVYGRANEPERLVEQYRAGRVVPQNLRGFSALPMPAQAAQAYVRTDPRIDAHAVTECMLSATDTWQVGVAGGSPGTVQVRRRLIDTPTGLTCKSAGAGRLAVFDCH